MRYAILVTQDCNLRCSYCYIGKRPRKMSLATARRIVDFVYARTPERETLKFGFFGGEPLLEFPLIRKITGLVEQHPQWDPERVTLSLITNGTIFNPEIAGFVRRHAIDFAVSCDGPPAIHDASRRFRNGRGSAWNVERNLRRAVNELPCLSVNAVFGPQTLPHLPATVAYLSSLGVRQIHLNADISANWSAQDADRAAEVYAEIGRRYVDFYLQGDPHFINLIDAKIAVILRRGYRPLERCRMGSGELAFAPDGTIYPCERLVGEGGEAHSIGHVTTGIKRRIGRCLATAGREPETQCPSCSVRDYCMNWCGCTNYLATGSYGRVGPFHCASERAVLTVAAEALQTLEKQLGATFFEHLSGSPSTNSRVSRRLHSSKEVLNEPELRSCTV